jgi:NADH dehydrogenase FAD-containing subunit
VRLARRTRSANVAITLVNGTPYFVERIRQHQIAVNQPLRQHHLPTMLRGTPIRFVQGWATAIHPSTRQVTTTTPSAAGSAETPQTLGYDTLLYALGSYVDRRALGDAADHVYTMDAASASKLAQRLPTLPPGSTVAVIGGGLTGIETTTEIAEAYPQVRVALFTAGDLGDGYSALGGAYLKRSIERLGIALHERTPIHHIAADGMTAADGRVFPAACIVWAGGFAVPTLAKDAGIAVNGRGQVRVDDALRSVSHPDIMAVGDSAAFGVETREVLRMACATAMPMGAQAAENIAATLRGEAPSALRFGFVGRCISLGRHDGLIQFVDHRDRPLERIVTGRAGAFVKEMICRMTTFVLYTERSFRVFQWSRPIGAAIHHESIRHA